MKKLIITTIFALCFALTVWLVGCHTINGIGRDLETATAPYVDNSAR